MKRIDSHQHFWIYNSVKDAWITDDMQIIQRDFMPEDLFPVLQYNHIEGCVAVQADQSEAENEFLLGLAATNPFVKGVVGWVDLRAGNVEERLVHYKQFDKLKGFRHILQAEDGSFMHDEKFRYGISLLNKYGYTYDILIAHYQLSDAIKLVAAFPEQPFVIDHLAKPDIANGEIAGWQKNVEAIAQYPNVSCKVSGYCTEADWYHWQPADVEPYLDVVFSAFGPDRVMYGSDWPVSLLAGGYNRVFKCTSAYVSRFDETVQHGFWSGNATKFYNLG